MAWEGFFSYAGNEVINAARTEAYAEWANLHWFTPLYKNPALPLLLSNEERYLTPAMDDAPWVDPDIAASEEFLGAYPLEVAGIEDSTRTSEVVESTLDGGVAGRLRNATKTVVFNVVLIASTNEGADYGFRWLKRTLLGGACDDATGSCNGSDLCYLSSEPTLDMNYKIAGQVTPDLDYDECLVPYLRTLRKVVFNNGPKVTAKRQLTDGGAVWTATFTGVAGSPFEFGAEIPVIAGFLDPNVEVPWAGGVIPDGGVIDLDGEVFTETDCAPKEYAPLFDPNFVAVQPPPGPPNVPIGNYKPPVNWRRRQFTIPKQFVPLWGDVVPVINVHTVGETRNLRLRFYADSFMVGSNVDDPCGYCGDIVMSYIPSDSTLTFDGVTQTVHVTTPGGVRRRADSLVFSTSGGPFEWPALTCGHGYIVTLDLPQQQAPPVVDLSLYSRDS